MREFLGQLGDPALTEVAYEAVNEVEQLIATGADAGETLASVVTYLADAQRRAEQQKLLAEIRRSSVERAGVERDAAGNTLVNHVGNTAGNARGNAAENAAGAPAPADELSLFAELVKKNQATNLRRIGPVKRLGS